MRARYIGSCVGWPEKDVHARGGLVDMIDGAREITRETFRRMVATEDREELEKSLGYEKDPRKGMTAAQDWAIQYQSSTLHGQSVYILRHSGIDNVFR